MEKPEKNKNMEKPEKNKKVSKDLDAQTKEVLDSKVSAGNKIPLGMKIVIGVLAIIILGLLGYIMYQVGKKSTGPKEITDNIIVEDKNKDAEDVVANNNKISDITSFPSSVENEEVQEVIDRNSLEVKDINTLEEELDGISDKYDDLKLVEEDLDNWSN